EARQRAADDRRVRVLQRGVRQAEAGRKIAAQVVVDGVGDAGEIAQDGLALGVGEVEGERLLAAVERLEVKRIAVGGVGADLAGDVAADGRILDLDDLGAEVGQDLRAERPGAELRHGQHAQPLQHRPGHAGYFPSPSVAWFFLGRSAVRRKVITRSPRWLITRVSTLTTPRSPCLDSRVASTVDSA